MSLAIEYFDTIILSIDLEDKLNSAINDILCISYDEYEDISFDHYDMSFELHGCKPDKIKPTSEQLLKLWELGFGRFWINDIDGYETYFCHSGDFNGYKKKTTRTNKSQ